MTTLTDILDAKQNQRLIAWREDGTGFSVLDRGDAADLMDVVRHQLGFSQTVKRFPRKDTCLAIYSHRVNTQGSLHDTLRDNSDWLPKGLGVLVREELVRLAVALADARHDRGQLIVGALQGRTHPGNHKVEVRLGQVLVGDPRAAVGGDARAHAVAQEGEGARDPGERLHSADRLVRRAQPS